MLSSKKTLFGALGAASLAFCALSSPSAAEDREFGYAITLTGASDYIFRGISYTQEDPTVNSYIELSYGQAYLAFWTSNIDDHFGVYGPWEQDIYLGVRPVTGPINWDLAVWYYTYGAKGGLESTDIDYFEFKVGASVTPITNLTVGVNGYYTPLQENNVTTASAETGTIEGSLAYTLPAVGIFTPTISGLYGHTETIDGPDGWFYGEDEYNFWNAGLKLAVDRWAFDFRYWDTDNDGGGDPALRGLVDERFVFSAAVNLHP